MLGTCALIMCHLAGLVLLQSDFLAGILFLRKSLISNVGVKTVRLISRRSLTAETPTNIKQPYIVPLLIKFCKELKDFF